MNKEFLNSLNKGFTSPFEVKDSESYRFVKKNQLPFDNWGTLRCVYKNTKGRFGSQTVYLFDMGNDKMRFSLNDNGEKADMILNATDFIDAVNKGEIKIMFRTYHSKKFDKDVVSVTFDVDSKEPLY